MKSATAFGVLALAASVAAHEHQHAKFHQRGLEATTDNCKVTYSTVTSYGEWGLVPVSKAPAPSSSSSSSSSAAPKTSSTSSSTSTSTTTSTSSTPPPPPPPTSTSTSTSISAPPPPAPTTSSAAETSQAVAYGYKAAITTSEAPAPAAPTPSPQNSPSTQSSSSSGSSGSIAANGDKWAFCYTPYTSSGDCKSADQVSSDISSLKAKGFTTIRTYANDCSGLANIGSACRANGMKMLVGIDINASGIGSYTDKQVADTKAWGQSNWDIVSMVIVGNEDIFRGWVSASGLAGLISDVKSQFQAAGYTGPVTTTEPLNVIEQYGSTLCPVVDVIGANIHPFFDVTVLAALAGPFVKSQLNDLSGVCNHQKDAYILETGWPSAGSSNGLAIPGVSNQEAAIGSIMSNVGGKAAVFSFTNDMWKAPGEWGVEQHWGCASLFQ